MNPNENHVSPLAHEIDELIETGQPTGIPAADDLAATIPQARPDFQRQLEDRLTAQIQFASQGDEILTPQISAISKPLRPRTFMPLTLAAAMLAVAIIGSFLLLQGGKKPDANLAFLSETTATPTPIRMVNVLIANHDLPRGYHFPSTAAELANIVGYTPWPESAITFNALTEDQGGLEKLEGKILRSDIYRQQPIMSNLLVNDLTQIASVGSDVTAILPPDQLAITLPISLLEGMNADIQDGAQVDIAALVAFVRGSNDYSDITRQKIVRNATVLHVGDFPPAPPSTAAPDIITLSASRDEVETLAFLINAEIPMTIELSSSPAATPVPDQTSPTIASQQVAVTIPTDQIVAAPIGSGIQAGDHVSISAKFTFVNASDELFQAVTPPAPIILIPPTPGAVITLGPSNIDGSNVHIISQEVIKDAAVVEVSTQDDNITIEVSQQEATVMNWLIDAKIPITLEKLTNQEIPLPVLSPMPAIANIQATAVPLGFQPGLIPQGMRAAEIDRDLITSDLSGFKADDMVDIAISFLTINKSTDFAGDPGVDNTTMPDNAYVATKTVFTGVEILVMGGIRNQTNPQVMTVALSPADTNLLTWVLDAHLPIALSVIHSNGPALAIENLPDGRISVEVPIRSITSDESTLHASNTVNILARMNFTNYDPNDPGSLVPKKLVSQIIIRDAEMTSSSGTVIDGDVMHVKLIISQDELPTLQWALKANLPLALQQRSG